jgi:hypothetical protein
MEQFAVCHAESRGYSHTEVRLGSLCHISYMLFIFLPSSFSNYVVSTWYSGSLVEMFSTLTTSVCSRSAYHLAAYHFPPNNVPHRRGILFLCTVRFGFDCRQWQKISVFCKTPRPALGPTKPPIQWVTGGALTGSKATGHRTPPPTAKVKNEWSYISTPLHALLLWTGTYVRDSKLLKSIPQMKSALKGRRQQARRQHKQ